MAQLDLQTAITLQARATFNSYLDPNGTSNPETWCATIAIRRVNGITSSRAIPAGDWVRLTFGKGDVLDMLVGWIEVVLPDGTRRVLSAGGIFCTNWSPHQAMQGAYSGAPPSQIISGTVAR